MAAALPVIGLVGSIGGTITQMMGQGQQASYQSAIARNQSIIDAQRANQEAAIGQRNAITEQRKADIVASRAQAVGAASGTSNASPTQVTLQSGIEAQGEANTQASIYDSLIRSQASSYQSQIDLFKANQINSALSTQQMGTIFSGISGLARGANAFDPTLFVDTTDIKKKPLDLVSLFK